MARLSLVSIRWVPSKLVGGGDRGKECGGETRLREGGGVTLGKKLGATSGDEGLRSASPLGKDDAGVEEGGGVVKGLEEHGCEEGDGMGWEREGV